MNSSEILTSTLIASVVSVLINFGVSRILKKIDFKHEYYKKVIDKRIAVYDCIEDQIMILKLSVIDVRDLKVYHRIFSLGEKLYEESTEPISKASLNSLWINLETREKVLELKNLLNEAFLEGIYDDKALISYGKKHYEKIYTLRDEIEVLIQKDILELYDFSKLKVKVDPNPTRQGFLK
ncbi:MAG: hypothetical protein ACK4WD_13825 [Flavobacteriales bacterium]|jgi:hypothetical protein